MTYLKLTLKESYFSIKHVSLSTKIGSWGPILLTTEMTEN